MRTSAAHPVKNKRKIEICTVRNAKGYKTIDVKKQIDQDYAV